MESVSCCSSLFGRKPCAEKLAEGHHSSAEMALDVLNRRSAAAALRNHEQQEWQLTSMPSSACSSEQELHHPHPVQDHNLPLHSPPHPAVACHHRHQHPHCNEQQFSRTARLPPYHRLRRLIVSSSFKSHLDRMSACGQRTCGPVITNFSSACGDASETTAHLLISTGWDDLVSPSLILLTAVITPAHPSHPQPDSWSQRISPDVDLLSPL